MKGLEAIIPVAPNTSYYHYYRTNGLVRHPGGWLGEDIDYLYDDINSGDPARRDYCNKTYRDGEFAGGRDRQHGDYNDFWAKRDLLPRRQHQGGGAHVARLQRLERRRGTQRPHLQRAQGPCAAQAYYHQGGHGGDPPMEMKNKWFTHFLYGVKNGVEKGPKAWIVREARAGAARRTRLRTAGRGPGSRPTPTPTAYLDYPNPAAAPVTLALGAGGLSAARSPSLFLERGPRGADRRRA